MVGSAHYEATNAGINILKNGGNAADAAFAVQLTLNVVEPHMSGIGGGCFILYYNNSNKNVYAIDGREEAPNAYNPYIFCDDMACFLQNTSNSMNNDECTCTVDETILEKYGDFNTFTSGGWTVGSPGTLYAFYLLHKYFGKTEWDAIFEDAINVANNVCVYSPFKLKILKTILYFFRDFPCIRKCTKELSIEHKILKCLTHLRNCI